MVKDVIRAAGGIVWRKSDSELAVALIYRARYGDWTLPKGKLKFGEAWQDAAIREVEEELQCQVSLGDFAGCVCYTYRGIPKVVLYWHMHLIRQAEFEPNQEIDQVIWLSPEAALQRLTYMDERELLRESTSASA